MADLSPSVLADRCTVLINRAIGLADSSPMHYHRDRMMKETERRWRVSTSPGGGFVSWRGGYGLPFRWTTSLDREELPYVVELDFATSEAGPQCRAVRFSARENGEPISARRVRDVPIAECIQLAIASAAVREERGPGVVTYRLGGSDVSEQAKLARSPEHGTSSDEHLRKIAKTYRNADKNPTQAVQDAWPFYSYSTVARWVMEARRRGLLPPTKRGRAETSAAEED